MVGLGAQADLERHYCTKHEAKTRRGTGERNAQEFICRSYRSGSFLETCRASVFIGCSTDLNKVWPSRSVRCCVLAFYHEFMHLLQSHHGGHLASCMLAFFAFLHSHSDCCPETVQSAPAHPIGIADATTLDSSSCPFFVFLFNCQRARQSVQEWGQDNLLC